MWGGHRLDEAGQIARQMMHVVGRLTGCRVLQPPGMVASVVMHQNGGHAECVRHREVRRHVLEHRRAGRRDAVALDHPLECRGLGLGREIACLDAADVLEQIEHADLAGHALGMAAGAVREDQAAALQLLDRRPQPDVGLDDAEIDVVDVVEEGLRLDPMDAHQTVERRAELLVVGLAQVLGLLEGHAQQPRDELAHAAVDLDEEPALGRVKRVV